MTYGGFIKYLTQLKKLVWYSHTSLVIINQFISPSQPELYIFLWFYFEVFALKVNDSGMCSINMHLKNKSKMNRLVF